MSLTDIIAAIAALDAADCAPILAAVAAKLAERGPTPAPAADVLLDVSEIATRLHKSESWVYHNKKRLPFIQQVGNSLRANPADIDKYLNSRRR